MAAAQVTRLVQQDLSGGMFPSLAPELIPPNGAFDITNGLLDEQNVVYRRGGSSYLVPTPTAEPRLLWSGYLKHNGLQTILATGNGTYRVEANGALVSLGFVLPPGLARAQVYEGVLYFSGGQTWDGATAGAVASYGAGASFYATAANRILAGSGSRIHFSNVPQLHEGHLEWAETDYHELPGGVQIVGMEGLRTSCVVFTTEGIWVIGGLNKNLVDEQGNVQQTLDRYSAQAVLWGNPGVAGWSGGLVVPCTEDIWLMELGVSSEKAAPFIKISEPIKNVYRGYVAAGYKPGVAGVYRGHYFLPILSGNNVVDVLVCNLAAVNSKGHASYPWTHLKGYGAQIAAYAATDQEGMFLGASAGFSRLLQLAYFTPSAAAEVDADGTAHTFSVTYRDLATGNLRPNTVTKARLRYEMRGPLSTRIKMEFGETSFGGAEWGEFNWGEGDWTGVTGPFRALSGEAPPDPEATSPYAWQVREKVRYARVRVSSVGRAATLSLRSLELFVRPDGKLF